VKQEGERLREMFRRALHQLFGIDLDSLIAERQHQFWVLGIDEGRKHFRDLLRVIDSASLETLNQNFAATDFGMQASAQDKLHLTHKADIFLVNTTHLGKSEAILMPFVIHEVCHYVEQTGVPSSVNFTKADEKNAKSILEGYDPRALSTHGKTWAELLSWAGRKALAEKFVAQDSLRHFLEASIPWYDRPTWRGDAIIEPTV
jgi:hypothetical protein